MDRLVDEILRRVQERLEESQPGPLCGQERLEESQTGPLCGQEKPEESQPGPLCSQEKPERDHFPGNGGLPLEFTDSIMNQLARRVADILVCRGILMKEDQSARGTGQSLESLGMTADRPEPSAGSPEAASGKEKGAVLMKRVLSEKDMISVCSPGITVLHVLRHTVFTDLAKDYVKSRGIQVIRDR